MTFVPEQSPAVTSKWAKGSGGPAGDETQNPAFVLSPIAFHPTQDPISSAEVAPTLGANTPGMGICVTGTTTHALTSEGADASEDGTGRGTPVVAPVAPCLDADMGAKWGNNQWVNQWRDVMTYQAQTASAVRRLTPVECERLQGFPDNWTNVTYRGKPASDGSRYKAIGNSMAVPVMYWLGQRIQKVHNEGPFRK